MNRVTPKLKASWERAAYLVRSLTLVWQASGRWTVLWVALLAIQGLLPVTIVYLSRIVVNRLVVVLGKGTNSQTVWTILVPVLLIGLVMLLQQLLQSFSGWVRSLQAELVRDHISALIHRQSAAIDFAFYESPEYHDRLHRVRSDSHFRPLTVLENLGGLFQNGITLVAMMAVLLPFGFWLPIVLLASTLPAFYTLLRFNRRQYNWWLLRTPEERRVWYYDWLLTDGEAAAEMRLFNLGNHFQSLYQTLRQQVRQEQLKLARDQSLAELGVSAFALLMTGLALGWMGWQALQGRTTLGDLALFYQAFNQGQGVMRSVMQSLGQIYSNSLYLGNLFEFLALKPQITNIASPLPLPPTLTQGIRFHQVSFHYPGSDRPVLKDFNLWVPAGKVVAIVGNNGAGKSTLIKLLCRLYDPQAGQIELDGTNLQHFDVQALRSRITVLFQQPVHYNATVSENIVFSQIAGADWGNTIPEQIQTLQTQITKAAEAAGADGPIARLPDGYNTLLGKWFETGADLSVGEWQRLSLARAFLRQAMLVILDEPTSAMDSWAEADWLQRFRNLVAGQTAIVITHRFTTAMKADLIYVMVDGELAETGNHHELVAKGGLYAQSWQAQIGQTGQTQE